MAPFSCSSSDDLQEANDRTPEGRPWRRPTLEEGGPRGGMRQAAGGVCVASACPKGLCHTHTHTRLSVCGGRSTCAPIKQPLMAHSNPAALQSGAAPRCFPAGRAGNCCVEPCVKPVATGVCGGGGGRPGLGCAAAPTRELESNLGSRLWQLLGATGRRSLAAIQA